MTSFTFSFEKPTLMQGRRSNFEIGGGGGHRSIWGGAQDTFAY